MVTSTLSFAVLFVILILMPFYLDYILQLEVKNIGFVMMAVPITLFIISPIAGVLYDKIGARGLTTAGLLLSSLAIISLCFLKSDTSAISVSWRLALLGAGQSIFLSPNTASVLSRINMEQTGVTSGMIATSRNLGMLVGVALSGFIFMSFYYYLSGGLDVKEFTMEQMDNFMMAFRLTLGGAAIIALTGSLISWNREE
jgi:MFS family permease